MDPSSSSASSSNGRQKRVLPSRSRRGGPGVGSCDADLLILEHQKRRFETESPIPLNTSFLLTTNSNDGLNFAIVPNKRYFDRPDVLEGFRKKLLIQTPSYREGQPDVGRFRPRGPEDTQIDTSDAAYERRHRKYETFEKRQRLREKEKLKHEQYKLKERIEQLRVMDASAFLTLPASDFSPAPRILDEDADAGIAALPGAYMDGAATYNEGERRRNEMLDIALTLEARFRVLLPSDKLRKQQPRQAAREDTATAPAAIRAHSRPPVSDAEVSEREDEVIETADGYNQQDKAKSKSDLVGKDSASQSPAPTLASGSSKRSGRASLPPNQKSKRWQLHPVLSRSPSPVTSHRDPEESQPPLSPFPQRPISPLIDIERLPDQEQTLRTESEKEFTPPPEPNKSPPAPEQQYSIELDLPQVHAVRSRSQSPTSPQRQTPPPDTQPTPAPEINPMMLEGVAFENVSEPPQSPPLPEEDKPDGSPMPVDEEALPEPPPPRFPTPPPIETLREITPPQPMEIEPVRRRRPGRPPKQVNQNSRLLELADAVQSISAGPPAVKRRRTHHQFSASKSPTATFPSQKAADPDQEPTPIPCVYPPTNLENPLFSEGDNKGGSPPRKSSTPSPAAYSTAGEGSTTVVAPPSISTFVPPPGQMSSISAVAGSSTHDRRRGTRPRGVNIVEYQSDTGELRRTESFLLIAGIRGSKRQTQRHQMAFGVKVPEEIMAPYDFWLPDEYLPEEELLKYSYYGL